MDENVIKPKSVDTVSLPSSARALLCLGYNLFNDHMYRVYDYELEKSVYDPYQDRYTDEINIHVPMSVIQIFRNLDENNSFLAIQAIKYRFGC
jgi:hypothetical protein